MLPPLPPAVPPPQAPPVRLVAITGERPAITRERPEHVICKQQFEPWTSEGVEVQQITTLRQLRAEGTRMANCVASYRESVEEGDVAILHATVNGEPLTISVDLGPGCRVVSDMAGFANRRAQRSEWAALRPFFEKNGIG